ncbi:hypothetical protein CEE44_01200 [Candidatus Woesearchaeota archaeon B3_Woes]|nr:MAG: hypothetical protein CEE44_01200 [Candidatus Woesearchaeota archaeon B3_Woes]
MIYSTDELRRCFEAGYPFGLFEHLLGKLRKEAPPPPPEIRPVMKTDWSEFNSDITKEQRPFYTREQIFAESTLPYVNNLGNNIDVVCSTSENTGEEIKIEDKGKTIDIMV